MISLARIGINKKIIVPSIISFFFSFLYYFYFPVLSIYFKSVGIRDELLGVVFAFFPLIMILLSPVIGILSDHAGRKRIIYLGVLSHFLAVILYLWPATLTSIIIGRILAGIAWTMVGLITLAKIQDELKQYERGSKAGVFLSIGQAGVLIGTLIGPLLAETFFLRLPFIISATGTAILLVWLVLWKSHHKPVLQRQDFNPLTAIKEFWEDKRLRAMAFIGMAMHTRIAVISIFLPLLVLELGAGYKEVGIIFSLRGAFHLLQGFAGRLVDKKGSRNILVLSVIITAALIMITSLAKTYVLLLILLGLESLIGAFWNVSAWTYMSDIGEKKKMEGVVVGSYNSLARIGHFVFATTSGFIAATTGIKSLFVISGALIIGATLLSTPSLTRETKTTPIIE